ncbi:MAG TPA: PIN domain-containing protein [Verrucomicrobiae bacterium]|jgi:predicted nucleic acid-binding protein|nr:PIN domain-containing protein [Verrucomicrobiae bacterium]
MTGLDCNILVQLALHDHPSNISTIAAVQALSERGERLVFPSLVVDEFLHVTTDERRFNPPLTMTEGLDWVEGLLSNSTVGLLEPTPASVQQALRWMRQFNLGRKRILDTQLAAIFHTSNVTRILTSNPADFAVFGVFDIITP